MTMITDTNLWIVEKDDDDDGIENQSNHANEEQVTGGHLISPNWHQQVTMTAGVIHRIFRNILIGTDHQVLLVWNVVIKDYYIPSIPT